MIWKPRLQFLFILIIWIPYVGPRFWSIFHSQICFILRSIVIEEHTLRESAIKDLLCPSRIHEIMGQEPMLYFGPYKSPDKVARFENSRLSHMCTTT